MANLGFLLDMHNPVLTDWQTAFFWNISDHSTLHMVVCMSGVPELVSQPTW